MPLSLSLIDKYQLALTPYDERPLNPTEVRAAAILSAISHGTEISLYRGTSPFEHRRFNTELRLFEDAEPAALYPASLGYEWVGEVVAVGTAVAGYQPGDRVHLPRPHRQTHTFEPAAMAALGVAGPLPESLVSETAVFLNTTSIALQAIHDARIKVGDRVAVFGLGVLGLITVTLAYMNGASQIVAIDPIVARREAAQAGGATDTLDPRQVDVGHTLKKTGRGVDTAIEFSGSYAALQQAIRSVKMGGLVVAAGFYQGGAQALNLGEEWLHNRVTMVASMQGWGNVHRDHPLWSRPRLRKAAIALLANGRLQPAAYISRRLPFAEAETAYRLIDEAPADHLKIVLDYA